MRRTNRRSRPGFSLLEMVLALAIGMTLLLALYLAFNTYLGSVQAGRDAIAESAVARGVLNKMANDINNQIGADDVRVNLYPYTANALAEAAEVANPSGTPPPPAPPMVKYNHGVYYEMGKALYLSNYRVKRPAADASPDAEEGASDMAVTIYWIVTDGGKSYGLARREINQATSPDIDLDPSTFPEQKKYIIAPEVKSIAYDFHNGSGWGNAEWDGSAPLFEGGPSLGPPAAIRITITLRKSLNDDADDTDGAAYTQIVALPTSNNFPAATMP